MRSCRNFTTCGIVCITAQASLKLPQTIKVDRAALTAEPPCDPKISPAWREAQVIDGVKIDASPACSPDNPAWIAAAVKGTNNVSMDTLMKTGLSPDTIIKTDDLDGDGDPDRIFPAFFLLSISHQAYNPVCGFLPRKGAACPPKISKALEPILY